MSLKTLTDRLIYLTEKEGVTNYRLAKDIEVTEGTIRAWKKGLSEPTKRNLEGLANYFNVHPAWLKFGDKELPPMFQQDVLELFMAVDLYVKKHPKSFRKIKQAVELVIEES